MATERDEATAPDAFSRLRELLELRDSGAISTRTFKARKRKILTEMWDESAARAAG
ncbi:MAG TPA: hypothetical protein VFA83_04890 [Acidimicrobiales bacterium]|nr:hypothetical protein [Acidimicrobiales bacterium]HZQ84148.1 hypothetical protein [Acidimicrobiales bacterium]